jgi:uncharacterized membrane protein
MIVRQTLIHRQCKLSIMRRVQVFIVVLTVSLSIIFALLAVSVYLATTQPTQYSSSSMGQMWGGMGGMMGGGNPTSTSYFWIIPAALIGIAVTSVIGLAFYLAVPEIKIVKETNLATKSGLSSVNPSSVATTTANVPEVGADPYELISRTMTADEKKVMDVLVSHDGKYLQKYIRSEIGLSRLKTHRIVARLAEREIVTVKQVGNTNEVAVSDWLRSCKVQKAT